MSQQKNSDQLHNLEASQFVYRNDVVFSWGNTISLIKALPGFRAAWFASDYDVNGDMRSQNGVDGPIVANGLPIFSMGTACPMVTLAGSDYFVDAASGIHTITGAETHINPANRGLTLIAVFNPDAIAGSTQQIAGKWGTIASHYRIYIANTGIMYATLTDTINGAQTVTFPTITANWIYVMLQWDQANNLVYAWVNDNYLSYSRPNLNQLATGNQPFCIGANNAGSSPFSGDFAFVALFDQYSPSHRMLRESALGGWPFFG